MQVCNGPYPAGIDFGSPAGMTPLPTPPTSRPDVDEMLLSLEVESVDLRELCAAKGCRIRMESSARLLLFYSRTDTVRLFRRDSPTIELLPHTLVLVRPERAIEIEASTAAATFICARFRASLGGLVDPFALLAGAVVQQLSVDDPLESRLRWALSEFLEREVGVEAMLASMLKQILVSVVRRALVAGDSWIEALSLLEDRRIGSALNYMLAAPGARHSILTLADASHLSRSAFIARFTSVVGHSPMAALRQLRMRRAAVLLTAGGRSIEKVARHVGYSSRSSFVRAFVDTYGTHPGAYRTGARRDTQQQLPV
jgi:AraC-like DNA-binding protein